jgi:hypothetical protein
VDIVNLLLLILFFAATAGLTYGLEKLGETG